LSIHLADAFKTSIPKLSDWFVSFSLTVLFSVKLLLLPFVISMSFLVIVSDFIDNGLLCSSFSSCSKNDFPTKVIIIDHLYIRHGFFNSK